MQEDIVSPFLADWERGRIKTQSNGKEGYFKAVGHVPSKGRGPNAQFSKENREKEML